ncbi:MAG: hypothetical protein JSR39_10285 [Verrucomicrobia bacterium]|nr:hypothetical protein [Verrucomicrobiota bacterium]
MHKKGFSFRIASDSSKEKVFAEIYYCNEQWAEISQEEKEPIVIFFSPSNAKNWEFPLEEALEVLENAKKSLLNK